MRKKQAQDQSEVFDTVADLMKQAFRVVTSDPQECIRIAENALDLSQRYSFRRGMGHAQMHIGLGRYHQGELAQALEKYQIAEQIFDEDQDYLGLRSVYNNIGIIYSQWKDRENALEYFQRNLDLEEKCSNPKLSCTILVNIGSIHLWSNDFQEARECYDRALKLAQDSHNDYGLALATSQIAYLLKRQDRLEEAKSYFEEAYQIYNKHNDLTGMIRNYLNRADISRQEHDTPQALSQNLEAMRIAEQIGDKSSMSISALNLANLYHELGEYDLEKEKLEQCLALAQEHGYRSQEIGALRELAHWHERKGNYKLALQYYWDYQEAKNYLIDQERNHHIQELRIQLQVTQKEREMELVRKANEELEKKNSQIIRQKNKLEKVEKALKELNSTLEQRVEEEIENRRVKELLLVQKSKLESLGRMAAGIAHEINQPLGMINIGIQNLILKVKSGMPDISYIKGKEEYFRENIQRIEKIINHVRLFSRDQQDSGAEKTELVEIVENAVSMVEIQCREQRIKLSYIYPDRPISIMANKYRLEQVLLNLLTNAMDSLEERFDKFGSQKSIEIRVKRGNSSISLEIEDNGTGITEETLQRIFDPFFTTKTESRGTGLGLSICYGIINDMNGSIICESKPDQGTVMRIELPNLYKGERG